MGKFQIIGKFQFTFVYFLSWACILLWMPVFIYAAYDSDDMQDGVPMAKITRGKVRTLVEQLNELAKSDAVRAVFLGGYGLQSVPSEVRLGYNIVTLSLYNNNIAHIRRDDFEGLVFLRELSLVANQIDRIDPGALAIESLRILDLSNNKLQGLNEN